MRTTGTGERPLPVSVLCTERMLIANSRNSRNLRNPFKTKAVLNSNRGDATLVSMSSHQSV